jgi:hypothetical protein
MKSDDNLLMLMIHSLQTEAWAETVMIDKECKQEFKMRVKDALNSCKSLNKFLESWTTKDDYEVSAEVSDAILKLIKLPEDKINILTEYINDYVEKNKE